MTPPEAAGPDRGAEAVEVSTPRWLSGIVPPVCTPLDDRLELDVASFERLLAFLLEAGVDGLFVLGSTSEAVYLTDRTRDQVIEVAVRTVAGQVPVLAGAIDTTTARVIGHARRATLLGVDGIVATAPFYARANHPAETKLHYRTIHERVAAPLVAYDIPPLTHLRLEPQIVVELAEEGVVQGAKDSSGDLAGFRQLVNGTRGVAGFSVFTGSEALVDCALQLGAEGAVPGLANVDPHGYVALYRAARAGDWDEARRLQERATRLLRILGCARPADKGPSSSIFGGYKTALWLRGVIASNAVALPLLALAGDEVAAVRTVLEQEGLL